MLALGHCCSLADGPDTLLLQLFCMTAGKVFRANTGINITSSFVPALQLPSFTSKHMSRRTYCLNACIFLMEFHVIQYRAGAQRHRSRRRFLWSPL